MATPDLIYCANGNTDLAQIAINAGFLYGARLPSVFHHPIHFADQDWKNPDKTTYMTELAKHKPHMATVLDLERQDQFNEVLNWAEEAAQHVQIILIIPKFSGAIAQLPRSINGAHIRLAYSVPTRYGGTDVPAWEFLGWPVHLLGGSPQRQMELARYLNVHSADGNMHQKLAVQFCIFWTPGNARYANNRYWPKLQEADNGRKWQGLNAHHEAFRRSCQNIVTAWKELFD
jgi:hypothetical protein